MAHIRANLLTATTPGDCDRSGRSAFLLRHFTQASAIFGTLNENTFKGKESGHWACPGAQDRAGTLTSWLFKKISLWAGSICTEMSHVWARFLGFCSLSLHSWSLCLSWESLGQSRRVTGQWGPGTTNDLCTPGRTGKGTPLFTGVSKWLPADF